MSHSCPPPAYAEETGLAGLSTAELLPVVTLRLFAMPWREPDQVSPDWRGGLLAAGLESKGVAAFDRLFQVVVAAHLRPLDVRCPRCANMGADEARLLQLLSFLQRWRVGEAEAILKEWVPPAVVRIALPAAQTLAEAMADCGLRVPLRHAEAAFRDQFARVTADRGVALVQ